jgi:hypothetical protein
MRERRFRLDSRIPYLGGVVGSVESYHIVILASLAVRDKLLSGSAGEFLVRLAMSTAPFECHSRTFSVRREEMLSHSLRACVISPMRRADCDMVDSSDC